MKYKFQVKTYKRFLKKNLITSRCTLQEREGLIVRLEDDLGHVGFGEIAPMHFLGSESFSEAKSFCAQITSEFDSTFIESIDSKLPACQFGIQSAQERLNSIIAKRKFEIAGLYSISENIDNYKNYRTFKCKIGITDFEQEKKDFLSFQEKLPKNAQLRLDANGALSLKLVKKWLNFLDNYNIQFLEQPLPKGQETLMSKLTKDYSTSIALDESIINVVDLKKVLDNHWPGWLVIKPSLIGNTKQFRKLRNQCDLPIIYSSVFETAIGFEAGLALAAEDLHNHYDLGFGTINYFSDDLFTFHQRGSHLNSGEMTIHDYEKIWTLCKTID